MIHRDNRIHMFSKDVFKLPINIRYLEILLVNGTYIAIMLRQGDKRYET